MKSKAMSIIINEIMSSKSSSTIILTESDGEHSGFINDLANNYRTTFWVNASYDNDYSLAFTIAYNVFENNNVMLNRLNQFSYCKLDFTKDLIIINAVLDYIESLNYNCLLVIDNMETIVRDYNLRAIEHLLKNCPGNLKIVIVSNKFLDLNYSLFIETSPKLISKEQLGETFFDERIIYEPFTEDEFGLLYQLSKNRFAESAFIESIFPGGVNFILKVCTRYPSIVMQTGKNLYNFNPKLADLLLKEDKIKNLPVPDYDIALYNYYIKEGGDKLVKALRIALSRKDCRMIDYAVKTIIEHREEVFHLYEYSKYVGYIDLGEIKKEYIYARYFQIINDILGATKYLEAIEEAKDIIVELEENHPLQPQINSCYIRALYGAGKKIDGAEYAREYVAGKIEKYGEEYLVNITGVVEKLAIGLQNLNMAIIVQRFRMIEKFLADERFCNEFWYVNMLQTFVGCNLDLGNYKRAIEHLNHIKTIIPYYVIPCNMIGAYFYAGDMELAKRTAEDIIEASKFNNVTSNLTDAYVLLSLVAVYYNKIEDAVPYLNEAVKHGEDDEYALITAIAVRAIVYAKAGMLEYAKDLAMLYMKKCEITKSNFISIMQGVSAYCHWKSGQKELALLYARRCVVGSTARSAFWLISTAIIINYMFDDDDFKTCKLLVEKFFISCRNSGMEMLSVICGSLFEPIIGFAYANGIEREYIEFLKDRIHARNKVISNDSSLKIKFMGNTSVSVDGEELIWKTRKAKELFLLYILKGEEGIARNEIMEMFWGDYVYVSAINNLKTTNNIIRNTLAAKGLHFRLEYSNSKYSMFIKTSETDFDIYKKTFKTVQQETDFRRKLMLITRLVNLYDEGFASDIKVSFFAELNENIKDELVLLIMKFINDLMKEGEYLEARKIAMLLKKLKPDNESNAILADIDKKLFNL